MGRIFAYARVSTTEQSVENQRLAIARAGYDVEPSRLIEETISGSVPALQRPAFAALVGHKLEAGDTLVVLKLDRLGRDNIDVQQTISALTESGIRVVSLDLPAPDLACPTGKLMLQMFAALAEFERSRLRERTKEGLERAKAEGRRLGRPVATGTTEAVQAQKRQGQSQSTAALRLDKSLSTIKRHWNV